MSMAKRYAVVRERMADACRRSGRSVDDVTLVAVSKTFPAEAVEEAFGLGMRVFGESRVQEAIPKIDAVQGAVRRASEFHFIGHLQSNKAKAVPNTFSLVHSVDRPSLAEKLDEAAGEEGVRQPVLVQVNLAEEPQKSGVHEVDLRSFMDTVCAADNLGVYGLMMIPPFDYDEDALRELFSRMRRLFDDMKNEYADGTNPMQTLSMGMSGDYPVAIEEGATMIRVGSAIFGSR